MACVMLRLMLAVSALMPAVAVMAQDDLIEEETEQQKDKRAIENLGKSWESAWNQHDQKALAALLSEEADFITLQLGNVGPVWLRGRQQFSETYAAKHKTWYAASVWRTRAVEVRFLRPDLALARVPWATQGDKVPHRKHGEMREGIFTWVVEKRGGSWLIIASQETEGMPALPGQ